MLGLDKNKKYILGCSFGPDSMALFDMLIKEEIVFSAALVNYNLREESANERNGFIAYCQQNNIPYFIKEVEKGSIEGNLEEKCRIVRYEWFSYLTKKYNFDAILIAHHQDDFIETYLLQKQRNNHVLHYGLLEKTVIFDTEVIRPLLNFKKDELLQYCLKNRVSFAVDSSNMSNKFARNKIRHEIVEKLSQQERENLLKEIEKENQNLSKIFKKIENINLNKISSYKSLNDVEKHYALNNLLYKTIEISGISFNFSKEIFKLFETTKRPIIKLRINSTLYLIKDYENMYFSDRGRKCYSFSLDKPGCLETNFFYLDFTKGSKDRNVKRNDYPITIRLADKKDKVKIKDYYVEVRRLFIDWKMPLSARNIWPVIVNKDGDVIYIPRYRKDFKPDKSCNFYVKM